jgi:hypothetical protein
MPDDQSAMLVPNKLVPPDTCAASAEPISWIPSNLSNILTHFPCLFIISNFWLNRNYHSIDAFEERAAIVVYDGGLCRSKAEDVAAEGAGLWGCCTLL